MTAQQLFQNYITTLKTRNLSPCTIRNYETGLVKFLQFLRSRGIASFSDIERSNVRGYIADLYENGASKSTVAQAISALKSFSKYIYEEGYTGTDLMAGISSPKLDKRLPSFLSISEIQRLIEMPDTSTSRGERDKAILEVLYSCGLRIAELEGLDLQSINLETKEVRVWGKGSKERITLMGQPAVDSLRIYIDSARPEFLRSRRPTDALFLSEKGRRLNRRLVEMMVRNYGRQAGISKRVYPHLLRHTFATHMLDGDANLRVVQELLGHALLNTTQIYTHVSMERTRETYLKCHPLA
jgi:integrase/recombinase XerC